MDQFTKLTAGVYHTCAIRATFQYAYCWGMNVDGQLGDGTTTDRWAPAAVAMPASHRSIGIIVR